MTSIALSGTGGTAAQAKDVTWGYRSYNTSLWATPGADLAALGSLSVVATSGQDVEFGPSGLIGVVQAWLDTPSANNGLAVSGPGGANYRRFASRSSLTNPPRLIVNYSPTEHVSTRYTFDSVGRISRVIDGGVGGAILATGITYYASNLVSGFDTSSIQPVSGGGTRRLEYRAAFRDDGSRSTQDWTYRGSSGGQSINALKQSFEYGPAGLVTQRNDVADETSSRHYEYDALLRLTCETRGDGSTQIAFPADAADCTSASQRVVGLYAYGDGQDPARPQDVRLSSFQRSPTSVIGATTPYYSPSMENSSYAGGSTQTQQTARSSGNIVYGYDVLGRRIFEYDSANQTLSRRDYTYAPNGQLASVAGTSKCEETGQFVPYVTAIRYDANARPVTVVHKTSDGVAPVEYAYELFWDEDDRVSFVSINAGSVKWYYHYIGNRLVAATRRIGGVSKQFWFIADERGLIYRMVDGQGATYWQARWAASSWRALIGTYGASLYDTNWVPFALPGQIVLTGTAAHVGSTDPRTRPEIALNRRRAYDPFDGTFLQADPADLEGRLMPEGYQFVRSNPIALLDDTGEKSRKYNPGSYVPSFDLALSFDSTCSSGARAQIEQAARDSMADLLKCKAGLCNSVNLRRLGMFALSVGKYYCPHRGSGVSYMEGGDVTYALRYNEQSTDKYYTMDYGRVGKVGDKPWTYGSAGALNAQGIGKPIGARGAALGSGVFLDKCVLRFTVWHEAMHSALASFGGNAFDPAFSSFFNVRTGYGDSEEEHRMINVDTLLECLTCRLPADYRIAL